MVVAPQHGLQDASVVSQPRSSVGVLRNPLKARRCRQVATRRVQAQVLVLVLEATRSHRALRQRIKHHGRKERLQDMATL